jgi:hypothetical protein
MQRKNNWSNHLLNFLAVILGVYLAFYINEKAKEKGDRERAMYLKRSLIEDLNSDINTFETYQIPFNQRQSNELDSLLEALMSNNQANIARFLSGVLLIENYTPTTTTYASMMASDQIKLIDDWKLQKDLSSFYEGLAIECQKKSELQVDYFIDNLMKWLTANADLTTMQINAGADLKVLINHLIIYQSFLSQKVDNYQMILVKSNAIKNQLNALVPAEKD